MRVAILLFVGSTFPTTGCSALVAVSGTDPASLTTREQVHAKFGTPTATGLEDGNPFEEYWTRRKIAENRKFLDLWSGAGFTLGFGELIQFPQELCIAGTRSLLGQTLRFVYDDAGNVTAITHEGEHVSLHSPREPVPSNSPADPKQGNP